MKIFIDLQDGNGPSPIRREPTASELMVLARNRSAESFIYTGGAGENTAFLFEGFTSVAHDWEREGAELTIVCPASELTEALLRDPEPRWNPNLFKLIDKLDDVPTAIFNRSQDHGITHVADLLLIYKGKGGFWVRHRTGTRREMPTIRTITDSGTKMVGFGPRTFDALRVFLRDSLGIDLDLDVTHFPWGQLAP
ncbi:hypothetical protein HON52_03505 [Candidatus Uhrbacteria bacterium]|jgi:hypothetical protein|nr:hypothetical protein [Candidatus Uhrbacteria bacterium]